MTPALDGSGPNPSSIGPCDGRGRDKKGRGQSSKESGAGKKTGGERGECD